MTNRIGLLVCVSALGMWSAGCGGPAPVAETDAGRDVGTTVDDAGIDAGQIADAGTDARAADAFTPRDTNPDGFVPGGGILTLSERCPPFTPCGGSIVGTWRYESICIEHAEALSVFPSICVPGTVIESGGGTVTGMVTATPTSIRRMIDTSTNATVLINSTCSALGCATIQSMVMSRVPGATASCTAAGTTPAQCRCAITFTTSIDETQGYTIAGNVMTTADMSRSTSASTREPGGCSTARRA